MKFLRKLALLLAWLSPAAVAVYLFAVNHWQAGIGASFLAIFCVFVVGMSKAFVDRYGEDMRDKIREEERKRILDKVA